MTEQAPMTTHLRGRIDYLRDNVETGRDRVERIDHKATGCRTLRAFCEMDDVGLTRDVTMFLDHAFRPLDAFCRVTDKGAVKGVALFLCEEDAVLCEGRMAEAGRISQRLPLSEPAGYLGLHPLVGDALVAIRRGTVQPGIFLPVEGVTNSISPNGDRELHAMPVIIEVAYIGPEPITVKAGPFACERYALHWHPDWPPADLWVCGADALFVQMEWPMFALDRPGCAIIRIYSINTDS